MIPAIDAVRRRTRQFVHDPVLRAWIFGRAVGRWPAEPPGGAGNPPYLNGAGALDRSPTALPFADLGDPRPTSPLTISLAGEDIVLNPGDERDLVAREFEDRESLLAFHRFAWVPFACGAKTAAWVNVIWRTWVERHGAARSGWAWHPYTCAERLLNILEFARRHGLPGPRERTAALLADHCPAIADHLEYFGETRTGNHLANNGRGLFVGGLALGMAGWADLGGRILIEEADRIFLPSGILREGSSHYHLLVTAWYAEAWLAARAQGRAEAPQLKLILERALSAAAHLQMPGGFPLIGDVSPDRPPDDLIGLASGREPGWLSRLPETARDAVLALRDAAGGVSRDDLGRDGWLRCDVGRWSGIWHVAPGGWPFMPGHGHEDCGSFEIHFDATPLFRDLGRGTYEPVGDADRSGAAHNGLMIDGVAAYPPNKPYYTPAFRERICGTAPRLEAGSGEVVLCHDGFSRLGSVGRATRRWQFGERGFSVTDSVEGAGTHTIRRALHTTLPVEAAESGARVGGFRVRAPEPVAIRPAKRWHSYGVAEPATALVFEQRATLPWKSTITVEAA